MYVSIITQQKQNDNLYKEVVIFIFMQLIFLPISDVITISTTSSTRSIAVFKAKTYSTINAPMASLVAVIAVLFLSYFNKSLITDGKSR